jgi:hypothetical protein
MEVFRMETETAQDAFMKASEHENAVLALRHELETTQQRAAHFESSFQILTKSQIEMTTALNDRTAELELAKIRDREMRQRMERVERWYRDMKLRIDEFDECCRELGVLEWLSEFDKAVDEDTKFTDGVLVRAICKFKARHQGTPYSPCLVMCQN